MGTGKPTGRGTPRRLLSYSEVSKALDCQAAWDFRYGGHLAGDALKPKRLAPQLSAGRAWGRGVATLWGEPIGGLERGLDAIHESLTSDAVQQREAGTYDAQEFAIQHKRLEAIFLHYAQTADPMNLEQPERELLVPIPSRTGARRSSRYWLQAYLDGVEYVDGRPWLVEYKLRKALMSVELITLSRQIRWYAWAYREATGEAPAGVLVDERLAEFPKAPRILKNGAPSHAKDQLCDVGDYLAVCAEADVEPVPSTVEALAGRRWQQRVPVLFRDGELDEVDRELVSAAQLIGMLDRGRLYPLRNSKRQTCMGCDYRDICPAPDGALIDALFERGPAKKDRVNDEEAK